MTVPTPALYVPYGRAGEVENAGTALARILPKYLESEAASVVWLSLADGTGSYSVYTNTSDAKIAYEIWFSFCNMSNVNDFAVGRYLDDTRESYVRLWLGVDESPPSE